MRIQNLLASTCLAGALAALPAVASAATVRSCSSYEPTGNVQQKAARLLQRVQTEATSVRDRADTLRSYIRTGEETWQAHTFELNPLKTDINDMGRQICQLSGMRSALAPWQQETLNRVAPQIQLMADNTEDAINFINRNQGDLWNPSYSHYVNNLYREAGHISHTVKNSETYARLQKPANPTS